MSKPLKLRLRTRIPMKQSAVAGSQDPPVICYTLQLGCGEMWRNGKTKHKDILHVKTKQLGATTKEIKRVANSTHQIKATNQTIIPPTNRLRVSIVPTSICFPPTHPPKKKTKKTHTNSKNPENRKTNIRLPFGSQGLF